MFALPGLVKRSSSQETWDSQPLAAVIPWPSQDFLALYQGVRTLSEACGISIGISAPIGGELGGGGFAPWASLDADTSSDRNLSVRTAF